jgi:quinolinate synthase
MTNFQRTVENIKRLKRERKALILAHNYQPPEIQNIADFVGDSLALCKKAALTDAETIVFCGVRFMAESAALLNPGKRVLLPDANAGCPMADMVTPERLEAMQSEHPGAVTVCYVNSNAEVKALSDICCTSSNAEAIVRSIPEDKEIIFIPDKFLGGYVAEKTGRQMILWPGFCPTHQRILREYIEAKKREHPDALVLVHPECSKKVTSVADFTGSTGQIIDFCGESTAKSFIIGTENGILHSLSKFYTDKMFIPASDLAVCANMKRITLEKVVGSLETLEPEVTVDPRIAERALLPLERMLAH